MKNIPNLLQRHPLAVNVVFIYLIALLLVPEGELGAAVQADDNAALRYVTAVAHLEAASPGVTADLESFVAKADESSGAVPLATATLAWIASNERAVNWLRLADRCGECRFLPDNRDPEVYEMPPIKGLRLLANVALARSRTEIGRGAWEAASARIAAVYRLGERLASEGLLICVLTGVEIRHAAVRVARRQFRAGLPGEERRRWLALLDSAREACQEVIEQIDRDREHYAWLLARSASEPERLADLGIAEHPALCAVIAADGIDPRTLSPVGRLALVMRGPHWQTWVDELLATMRVALPPASSTASVAAALTWADRPQLRAANPVIHALKWNFSWAYGQAAALDEDRRNLAAELAGTP